MVGKGSSWYKTHNYSMRILVFYAINTGNSLSCLCFIKHCYIYYYKPALDSLICTLFRTSSFANTVSVRNLEWAGMCCTVPGSPLTPRTPSSHSCHNAPSGQWKLQGNPCTLLFAVHVVFSSNIYYSLRVCWFYGVFSMPLPLQIRCSPNHW